MVSKEFQELRDRLMSAPVKGETPIEEARAAFEALMAEFTPETDLSGIQLEKVQAGSVPAQWITVPGAHRERFLLYLHGGGFTMGSVQSHLDILARLARSTEARVLAIEYRLAPEHPFPAAIEDSVEAYRWLLDSGVEPKRIVVAGSSAGGGLVLSTSLKLRDDGDPLPAAGVCLCPFADMTLQSDSLVSNEGRDWVTRSRVEAVVETYLAGADPAQPLASPLLADLTRMPPLLIQAGSHEILVDDARRLAAYASSDGVPVELNVWPEMIHMWQLFGARVPEGREAIEKLAAFLLKKISGWN
jgi:monoterpene epsilon-lactone hydrolase